MEKARDMEEYAEVVSSAAESQRVRVTPAERPGWGGGVVSLPTLLRKTFGFDSFRP
jgi:hypothetical protein